MKPKTLETITRHLKGIVAALDREKEPKIKVTATLTNKKFKESNLTDLLEKM